MFWVFFGKVYFLIFVENQNDMECQGECKKENRCFGELKTVLVSGHGFKKPFEFIYCQEAREEDRRRGFLIETPKIVIGDNLKLKEMPDLYFGNPKLTIGKKYKVIDVEGSNVWVLDDENKKTSFGICRFFTNA